MSQQAKRKNTKSETLKAGCVVVNDKKEVLLVTNQEKKTWEFPKGHMDSGESAEQTAIREVKEETGYDVEIIKRLPDVTYIHGQTGEPIRVVTFQAKPVAISGEREKGTQCKWCPIDEARKIIYQDLVFLLYII